MSKTLSYYRKIRAVSGCPGTPGCGCHHRLYNTYVSYKQAEDILRLSSMPVPEVSGATKGPAAIN